jgi:ankyrin repeat protein
MSRLDQELMLATRENNPAEVSRLLSVGADVNVKDSFDRTPLYWACFNSHVHLFIELLEHGADIESTTSYGRTPLLCACYNGPVSVVIELLRRGSNTEVRDYRGDTPLHDASSNGLVAIVQALLINGANILAVNNEGHLPIRKAVSHGNSEVSKCLLQELYATTGRLPLHALLEDLTWIGDLNGGSAPPLRFALDREVLGTDDVVEILEFLVDRNPVLLSSRDQDGSSPLHIACRRGAPFTIVQSLVNHYKASVKSVTPQGDLPLFLACEMPETSLDTIFLLMKLYPDLVYR